MKDKIRALLDDSINDIFLEMEKELNIESGDISPMMYNALDEELNRLTEIIRDTLGMMQ